MVKKKKQATYTNDFKATTVARALKAKETGEESISAIAAELGIWDANIHNWIKAAKKANGVTEPANGKAKRKTVDLRGSDLAALSRELTQAMDRVTALKKRMRKLLDTD